MRMIAVVNQKGGVGKTTTTVNLAHALALSGKPVTAIDLDPQGHLSASLGVDAQQVCGIDEVLLEGAPIDDSLMAVREGLRLIPAGPRLGEMELLSEGGARRGYRLRDAATGRFDDQAFVLLDCPPASGLLLMNALIAADEVIMPVVGDYLGLRGLSHLMQTLSKLEHTSGRMLRQWIVLTRFHARRRLTKDVLDKLLQYFPGKVLATPIRETVALAESPSFGQTIFEYSHRSHGAADYRALAEDFMGGRMM